MGQIQELSATKFVQQLGGHDLVLQQMQPAVDHSMPN